MADNFNTTQKHRAFVGEPLGNKPNTAVPGIGKAIGAKLSNAGYSKASQVVGQYLVGDRNRDAHIGFMQDKGGANSRQSEASLRGISDWTNQNM